MTIDIYALISVGTALVIGAIPIIKGGLKDPDALIMYVDNRTELEKQDSKITWEYEKFMIERYGYDKFMKKKYGG